MLITLSAILSILTPALAGPPELVALDDSTAQAGVKLTLNRAEYWTGDAVRAQVEANEDGYLIVMRVDGDGRVRVVFPIDPDLDPFVRGGKRYELRGRQANESFRADDLGGAGIVFAALSKDPLRFDEFAIGDHWDYEALRLGDLSDDPEAALHRFVRRMSGNGRYTFDVQGYRVLSNSIATTGYTPVYVGVRDPYNRCYTCGFGDPWFDPWYDNRYGITISLGIGSVRDPWDPWYDPYWNGGYRYDPYWAYGASPWYPPYYPGQYAPYTVVNNYRPRAVPNPHAGERARPRLATGLPIGTVSGVVSARRTTSAPPPARPADSRARPRTQQGQGGAVIGSSATPPAAVTTPVPVVSTPVPIAPTRAQPEARPVFLPGPPTGQGGSGSSTVQRGASTSTGAAATSRARPPAQPDRGTTQQGGGNPPPAAQGTASPVRTEAARPVFREPVQAKAIPERRDPPVEARPVYREPASSGTTSRTAPATAEPPKSVAKPTEDRRAAPAERKADPAPTSRAPVTAAPPRSAPPPPPPPTQTTSRARAGSGGN